MDRSGQNKNADDKKTDTSNRLKIEERKRKEWFFYLQGFTLREIARELRISKSQVHKDIKELIDEWLKDNDIELEDLRRKELMKLDNYEKRITKAFNTTGADRETISKISREINLKLKIQRQRSRILGLEKIIIEATSKEWDMSIFSEAELARIATGENPGKVYAERNEQKPIQSQGTVRNQKKRTAKETI